MVSFSSSVINKSGKKFAPKPPARRIGAISAGTLSARASVERQTTSKTPQSTQSAISPESSAPVPTADPAKSTPQRAEESSQSPLPPSTPPPLRKSPTRTQSQLPPRPSTSQSKTKSTAIPIPTPRRRPSIPSPQGSASPHTVTPVLASTPNTLPLETTSLEPAKPQHDKHKTPQTPQNVASSPKRQRIEQPVDSQPAKRTKTVQPITKFTSTLQGENPHLRSSSQGPHSQPEVTPTTKTLARRVAKPPAHWKQSAEQIAENAIAAAAETRPRSRRRRQPTPENAESIEIAPTVVKMSDLCRDLRTGKKSKREMELQSMDLTELAKKKKEREERIRNGNNPPKAGSTERHTSGDEPGRDEAGDLGGPKMRIVNGEIIIDASSLQIDRHANAARNEGDLEEVEENRLTKRINAASFGKRTKVESWDKDMTDLFYRGLRMFGTDFMMISKMFPGRSRRKIKLKFSNEERRYPQRIKETLLGPREAIDLATYSEMTNTTYDDPRVIEQELYEEKKRIEAEHAKEKEAKEELLRNPGGVLSSSVATAAGPSGSNVLPSIEGEGEGEGEGGVGNGGRRERKKGTTGVHKFGGGTEEILGTIDDMPVSA
ncbi:transcription factor tfiiib component [Histoplasma capsulatum H143]|uniref:Transcription factor tfiiib component n=1 Tax=Ajellomyces capsulatus (strain H143) TaxID=544712 RepID=C6HHW6_AJECH|nr:transcription factor tfiiib component [Histoplasma capsulatum H143]